MALSWKRARQLQELSHCSSHSAFVLLKSPPHSYEIHLHKPPLPSISPPIIIILILILIITKSANHTAGCLIPPDLALTPTNKQTLSIKQSHNPSTSYSRDVQIRQRPPLLRPHLQHADQVSQGRLDAPAASARLPAVGGGAGGERGGVLRVRGGEAGEEGGGGEGEGKGVRKGGWEGRWRKEM